MQSLQKTFESHKRSFVSAFSICMTFIFKLNKAEKIRYLLQIFYSPLQLELRSRNLVLFNLSIQLKFDTALNA